MFSLARCLDIASYLVVVGHQTNCILLVNHQVPQGGSYTDCVFEFGKVVFVFLVHRETGVDYQIRVLVGVGAELLDVIFIRSSPQPPIDMGNFISVVVLAVVGKLYRESLERASVKSGNKAFYNELGLEIQPRNLADHFGF